MTDYGHPPHKLPDTLHELVATAIADASSQDRDIYVPDHSVWHEPIDVGKDTELCHTCLAGSVMAGTLELDENTTILLTAAEGRYVHTSDFTADQGRKLYVLDAIRRGNFERAYTLLYQTPVPVLYLNVFETIPSFSGTFYGWEEYDKLLLRLKEDVLPVLKRLGV